MRSYSVLKTMIGDLFLIAENEKLVRIYIGKDDFRKSEEHNKLEIDEKNKILKMAMQQLNEYFRRERKYFDLPLFISGTPFQQSVWEALMQIPYGETKSYYDIAVTIQNPKAVRAVGQANKANRLPIIIPCHRVIGKNNHLTGYAGKQTQLKEKLLLLEGAI